jgi:hypothetical protein
VLIHSYLAYQEDIYSPTKYQSVINIHYKRCWVLA